MKLYGDIKKGTKIIKHLLVESNNEGLSFHDALEENFVTLCRELDIPVPLWLKKNTVEFASFRRTFFPKEQFIEKVNFDRFEIRLE
ncbi:MAG: hypothetical protein ACOX7R_07495 [Acetivibrionales bacterium]